MTQPPEDAVRDEQLRRAREIERTISQKTGGFALANFVAAAFALIAGFIISVLEAALEDRFDFELPHLHWMALVVGLNVIYVAGSYAVAAFNYNGGFLALVFRIPSWVELRNFGDQRIARISYVALAAIPIAAYFIVENPLELELLRGAKLPLNIKVSFFIAFFLSLALLAFAVGCPREFHRRPAFEGAKTVNVVLTSVERSVVNVREEQEFFDAALDASKLELRAVAWLFYTLGLVLSVILLLRAALFVLNA